MKLGYSTWGMPKVPVDEALANIAQLGFDGVELTVIPGYTTELSKLDAGERKRIRQLLERHDLILSAIAAHSNLLSSEPEVHAANMARLKGAVDLAVELAQADIMPAVNTTPGGSPEEWDTIRDLLVERTRELVKYAQAQNVTIAMEPHVGAAIDTPEKVIQLLELVDSPFLKVNFDISHFDIIGLNIEETVAALAVHTVHTHVKDQRGRVPNYEFLIPGEGDFDYVSYLKAMRTHGYDGFITIEVSVMVQRRPDYDPFAAAMLSYETLSRAFIEAGISRY
ncbi:TPA: sugar phosphate isomerase/epimerase [Candidatus Poribacteria bacterium]|nr:sugar phosphate isomerase/epimerase [Candidatus Poribacteria bacterium]